MPGEGGGGAGSFDWVGLGQGMHEDSLESMDFFTQLMNQEWNKRFKEKELTESKRQFGVGMKEKRRGMNLTGIELMRSAREKADAASRLRSFMVKYAA